MTNANEDGARDVEDEITAVDRKRGNSNNPDDRGAHGGANASELLNPMGRLAGRLSRSSSQNYTRSLFASGLGREARMHIDSLGKSPETPYTATPRRPVVPPQNLGQQQAGYRMAMSHLQQLYAAADQGGQPPAVASLHQSGQGQAGAGRFPAPNQNAVVRYPDAKQKKLAIRPFDGKMSRWISRTKVGEVDGLYYAAGVVHNRISYDKLDEKGYTLTYRDGQRVVTAKDGGSIAFGVGLRRNVLVVRGKVEQTRPPYSTRKRTCRTTCPVLFRRVLWSSFTSISGPSATMQ
ncbi:hypothetical protein PC120_g23662 [Phytophthora cactorum]|nr:hypothetical protein PC120_g23662 [Phytophthora cactorum]